MKLKVVILSFFVFLFSFFAVSPVNAQARPAYYINTNPDVPQNLNTYTQSVFLEIASVISCQLTGSDPTSPAGGCLGKDPRTGKIGYVESNGGAIGIVGGLIASTFYIPVNTHDYGAYLASN